jgi:cation/acetate symporter
VGLIVAASRELAALPRDAAVARERWTRLMRDNYARAQPLGGLPPHSQAYAGYPDGTPDEQKDYTESRRNFLALMFCLMVGTAGMPHLLTRYYTSPTVAAMPAPPWVGPCSSLPCCTSAPPRWPCWPSSK